MSKRFRLSVALNDVDRGVYGDLQPPLWQHPSETTAYLLVRALAWCLHHAEGIVFANGLCDGETFELPLTALRPAP